MDRYNFTIQNTTTNSKTEIKGVEVSTIINILEGFNTKDKNNIRDAEKTVAKTKKTKKSYSPKDAPQDNYNIPIK